jgi:hypothetical protein
MSEPTLASGGLLCRHPSTRVHEAAVDGTIELATVNPFVAQKPVSNRMTGWRSARGHDR